MSAAIVKQLRVIDQLGGAAGFEKLVAIAKEVLKTPIPRSADPPPTAVLTIYSPPGGITTTFDLTVKNPRQPSPSGTGEGIVGTQIPQTLNGQFIVINPTDLFKGNYFVVPDVDQQGQPAKDFAMHFLSDPNDWKTVVAVFDVKGVPVKCTLGGIFTWAEN